MPSYASVLRGRDPQFVDFLQMIAENPRGWGNAPPDDTGVLSPLEREPSMYRGEIRNSPERPRDPMAPVAETLSPTLGGYGMGELGASTYLHGREGDWRGAAESAAPLLAMSLFPAFRRGKAKTGQAIEPEPIPSDARWENRHAQLPAESTLTAVASPAGRQIVAQDGPFELQRIRGQGLDRDVVQIGPHEVEVNYQSHGDGKYYIEMMVDRSLYGQKVDPQFYRQIFNGARQSIEDFIAEKNPSALIFEAVGGDPVRARAWQHMGQSFAERHGGTFEKVRGAYVINFPQGSSKIAPPLPRLGDRSSSQQLLSGEGTQPSTGDGGGLNPTMSSTLRRK